MILPLTQSLTGYLLFLHLPARKNKKLIKMRSQQASAAPEPVNNMLVPVIPTSMPQLVPTMLSVLKAIEPDIIYSGYDSTLPDTSSRLMTTLNRLGGQQVISAVKWAKSLPGDEEFLTVSGGWFACEERQRWKRCVSTLRSLLVQRDDSAPILKAIDHK